jgi:AmmeMemoRadiSam system protein B
LFHRGTDCPQLRWPLQIEHTELEGKKYIVLRDDQGIAPKPAIIPLPLMPIISRFDGTQSLDTIVAEAAAYGLTLEIAAQLADELHVMKFLESPEIRAELQEIERRFLENPVRPEALADVIYPSDPESLRQTISAYLAGAETGLQSPASAGELIGLICPHIDYNRGWQTYASAYSALEQNPLPDIVFLLGTSHSGGKSLFQFSKKDFRSPLGTFPAAKDIIDDFVNVLGADYCFRDEYLHKREHSLELQLPFLAYRAKGENFPRLVPILVGSFHSFLVEQHSPMESSEVADTVGVLAELIKTLRLSGSKVLLYGGVDLAHVGRYFGDVQRMSDTQLEVIRTRDQQLLEAVLASDEEKLFAHMAEDLDQRRICGFPSIYTMLAAFRRAGLRTQGHFIEYRQAVEKNSDCVVTFASACWSAV